jgi:sulfate adenylyltransferase
MAEQLKEGQEFALTGQSGTPVALMTLHERYPLEKQHEALSVFGTDDQEHPGVAALYSAGDTALAGDIWLFRRRQYTDFLNHRLDPAQTRAEFARRGWRTVVGFQTRNPVHRAHEYIQKCALESVDGLLLNPIVGATKKDDVPAPVRMRCYEVILEHYYPCDRVVLAVLPTAMRYAGPKEAIFHAIMRKNFGCTHFIVGRDHAGVGDYYGTYDAQEIFDQFESGELGIVPMKFEHAFYCTRCGNMATSKTCPHEKENHVFFSGTKIRAMLRRGEAPPPEFSRPEVAQVLVEAMAKKG